MFFSTGQDKAFTESVPCRQRVNLGVPPSARLSYRLFTVFLNTRKRPDVLLPMLNRARIQLHTVILLHKGRYICFPAPRFSPNGKNAYR